MGGIAARISLTLGVLTVLLGGASIRAAGPCSGTDCRTACPMHRAEPEPKAQESCCETPNPAPKAEICQCVGDNAPTFGTLANSIPFELPIADLPQQLISADRMARIESDRRIELRNHGPPGAPPCLPSIPRAPPPNS